jgi:hypothetical protein
MRAVVFELPVVFFWIYPDQAVIVADLMSAWLLFHTQAPPAEDR